MKLLRLALPLLVLPMLAGSSPAQQFEGIVTIRTAHLTSDLVTEQIGENADERARDKIYAMTLEQVAQLGGPADVNVMQFKGGRMRSAPFEMPGLGSAYMLLDVAGGMMRTVSPSRRGYYEVSLRGLPVPSAQEDGEAPMRIEPLGRTQVINGLRCTGYRVTQGDQVSHVWTTDDTSMRELMTGWLKMAGEETAAVQESRQILARYGAPVMTQEFDEEGGYRVEIWTLERKSLPDSLFVVPAGFTKMRMPGN